MVPYPDPDVERQLVELGWSVTPDPPSAEALVWASWQEPLEKLKEMLHSGLRWVQLPSAGVDRFVESGVIDGERIWTSAAGAYAEGVAEHAVALAMAVRHRLRDCIELDGKWERIDYKPLFGGRALVVGAGGIGSRICRFLAALEMEVYAVNRSGRPVVHAKATYPASELGRLWGMAENLFLSAPLTTETRGLVDASVLAELPAGACLVNVGRGELVRTADLVEALNSGRLGGAGLDVTDPEPLPEGHPLWRQSRAIITPHVANPPSTAGQAMMSHILENARRYLAKEPLLGVVDLAAGY